jgi:tetratricopeptide (TPR) repeat protein
MFGVRRGIAAAALLALPGSDALSARLQWVTGQTINITGKVVTSDGTPPPVPATASLTCGGGTDSSAQTQTSGKFSISVTSGQRRETAARPVPGYGIGGSIDMVEQRLRGCEVRVTLAGYRAEAVQLTGRRISDNPNVGTIILHPLSKPETALTPFSSLSAPKDARQAFETAQAQLRKRQFDRARANLEKAVAAHPQFAEAWYELGAAHLALKHAGDAEAAFARSAESDAGYIKPRLALLDLSLRSGDWKRILNASAAVVKLDAHSHPQAWYFNGVAHLQLGDAAAARAAALRTIQLDEGKRFPKARQILGLALEAEGDLEGAAKALREYVAVDAGAQDIEAVRIRLGEIEARLKAGR